jgi:Phosphotransferase enzyme family
VVYLALPSEGALDEVRRLAGPSATIESVVSTEGGQHCRHVEGGHRETRPDRRCSPVSGRRLGRGREKHVLRVLDGLGDLAPMLLGSDLAGRWSECPTLLISWLDGEADITPSDPDAWAAQLGRALARVHALPSDRLSGLPSVFERSGGSRETLEGPRRRASDRAGHRSPPPRTCSRTTTTGLETSSGATEC